MFYLTLKKRHWDDQLFSPEEYNIKSKEKVHHNTYYSSFQHWGRGKYEVDHH
jgi:bacillopeptidase F (M6 metalloprotease family)